MIKTVHELRKALRRMPGNARVTLQRNGNLDIEAHERVSGVFLSRHFVGALSKTYLTGQAAREVQSAEDRVRQLRQPVCVVEF